jgi:hypothetical protein
MMTGRPKKPITLSAEEREQLSAIANSRSLPHGLVRRVNIALLAADGIPNCTIAQGSASVIRRAANGVSVTSPLHRQNRANS